MMQSIPFSDTGYFSKIICDYLDQKPSIRPYYNNFPDLEGFKNQLREKQAHFPKSHRAILAERLLKQADGIELSEQTLAHIEALKSENTFTVTTGHQLNLFTGPLYFIYKIVNAINLAKCLKETYPEQQFVPVYWMASEDHDFEEISFFNVKGTKVQWKAAASGAVGQLSTESITALKEQVQDLLGPSRQAKRLVELFITAYSTYSTLAESHRYLVNELFSSYGLVILDGDDAALKQLFVPQLTQEFTQQTSHACVSETIEKLEGDYGIQVNPRMLNVFYIRAGYRERMLLNEDGYETVEGHYKWTKKDLLQEVNAHPERFSPNVILRPLYQEVILPNLCYIGGGGELAYWFELKSMFTAFQQVFPILLLRNSVLCVSSKQQKKMEKLDLRIEDLFLKQPALVTRKTKEMSEIEIDFSPQRTHLKAQFKALEELAQHTDPSFMGAVKAQEVKQLKGLDHLEKRLLKAQKRKLKDRLDRIRLLQDELFPKQSLAERQVNFSEAVLTYGDDFIETLVSRLDPLALNFSILYFDKI